MVYTWRFVGYPSNPLVTHTIIKGFIRHPTKHTNPSLLQLPSGLTAGSTAAAPAAVPTAAAAATAMSAPSLAADVPAISSNNSSSSSSSTSQSRGASSLMPKQRTGFSLAGSASSLGRKTAVPRSKSTASKPVVPTHSSSSSSSSTSFGDVV